LQEPIPPRFSGDEGGVLSHLHFTKELEIAIKLSRGLVKAMWN
jgi:hypothetical protein